MVRVLTFLFSFACLAFASISTAVVTAVDFAFSIIPRLFDPRAIVFAHPGHPRSPLASLRAGVA